MRQFPVRAQVYIWAVIAGGTAFLACSGVAAARDGLFRSSLGLWLLLLGCVMSVAASFLKVSLLMPGQQRRRGGNAAVSLGFVPSFFLLFGLGPFAAIVASCVNAVVMTCYPRRSHYFQVLFSMAAVTISVFAAGQALAAFGLTPHRWQSLSQTTLEAPQIVRATVGVALATAAYSYLNSFLVAAAVALTSRKSPLAVWRSHYQWVIPCYFAGASCAVISFGLFPYLSKHLWASFAVAVIAAPIPAVIYLVYRYHRDQEVSNLQHIDELQRKNAELETSREALARSKDELEYLYTSTVESLALAIDAKDRYTKEHIQRVKDLAVRIATRLGVQGGEMRALETGALLHDIGKLAIPEHILSKPGRLTEEEFEKVKCHPEMGARILGPVHFPFPVMPIVRGHHERWDGKGYPDGLVGEDIPLGARILAVADVYDALTSDRPYRSGWTHARAMQYIREAAGSHFDPVVVEAFLVVIEERVAAADFGEAPLLPAAASHSTITEEINRASFEYLSLYEISQTASVTLELSETLTLLANKLRLLFNASSCVLMLAGDRNPKVSPPRQLFCAAASGAAEGAFAGTSISFDNDAAGGMTELAIHTRQGALGVFRKEDLSFGLVPEECAAALEQLTVAMVVPLATDAASPLLGTVNLYHERMDAFDFEDLRVLQTISSQVARAIENAYEFDRTRQSAMTDALTGLSNARHLAHFLERELPQARTTGLPLTVLVLDLDGFKHVNDRLGHARGNEVLRDLGRAFQSALRGGDLVARYAGDEYVVVLPGIGPDAAQAVTENIRAVVLRYDGRPLDGTSAAAGPGDEIEEDPLGGIRIGISIGTASFPQDATDAATLIARADRAMYREKDARKDSEEKAVRQLLADIRPS